MDDMQDLNDDISDINEADSRTTVTPMDNCSIQFSRQRQVHGKWSKGMNQAMSHLMYVRMSNWHAIPFGFSHTRGEMEDRILL